MEGFEDQFSEMASPLNQTSPHVNLEDLKMDSNFAWLLCSLVSTTFWVIYITYYHSRILGFILTKLLSRKKFVGHGYFKVGSFTWSVLSGKIMFRDVIYMNNDYTVRVQDGWIIFRWWRSYVPKHASEDLSHSDTRLSILLNGYELHMYNRTKVYTNLEKLFGLESMLSSKEDPDKDEDSGSLTTPSPTNKPNITVSTWRDLIPVIKVDVSSGRVVFGNRLIPTTLSVTVEEAHFVYSTKPAASRLDPFMHFTKCRAENFKVILAPSPKYTGMIDEPPRYMGEGFVIVSSNNVELYYYMDQPGVVPEEPEMLQLANGDIVESSPPIWGIDIKCGKGTDFSYGPWADRQREHIFKFFFPQDYQPMEVTQPPLPGEKRQHQSFDIRLSTLNEATIDILFSKNKETNAVHVNISPGSYMEMTIPWLVHQDGYRIKLTGQLLHLEATTSLQYRSLLETETLEFNVKCHYPLKWNDHQEWMISLTGCKATAHLIYAHVDFILDLVGDWSSKSQPDLLHFVPYTVKFNTLMKEFEIILLCNEYNWIDCSSQSQENNHLAISGDLFDLSFDLPFVDFLPQTIPIRLWIQGESLDMSLYLPETSTSRNIVLALDANGKILGRDGNIRTAKKEKKWRKICQLSNSWVDCWSVPIVALCINYTYHPQPPLGPPPQANITTPEKEELLLSPMRIPRTRKSPAMQWTKDGSHAFKPTSLPSDKVSVELEIGSSVLIVYGTWLRNLVNLKENIFGDDQKFTDMARGDSMTLNTSKVDHDTSSDDGSLKIRFDPRKYRPLEVLVSVTMHDIQAHLIKNCTEKDPPCPMILIDRFGFEMKKNYSETILQVVISPSVLLITDSITRPNKDSHIGQGHLMLSGLQIRGHAMFSDEGRSLAEETLEYAWLIEVQLGILSGKVTTSQLHHLVTSLETLVILATNEENRLRPTLRPVHCIHGNERSQCKNSDADKRILCPTSEDIKYRMTRVAVDALDLYINDVATSLYLSASPIRVATCNLHGRRVRAGVTVALPVIQVRQFMCSGVNSSNHSNTNTATTSSGRSQHGNRSNTEDMWLEIGSVTLSPMVIEAAFAMQTTEQGLQAQNEFLKYHDENHKRLWYLWGNEKTIGRCGCIGGCSFFGSNRNGKNFFRPSRQDIMDGVNVAAFRINPAMNEPGFGQSILHDGQLVFHTPPYGPFDVNVQEPYYYFDALAGNADKLQIPSTDQLTGSPQTKRLESHKPSADSISVGPSPVSDRKPVRRRFSCASTGNAKALGVTKEVPYARLIDNQHETEEWAFQKDKHKFGLTVPESECPRSSVSDSKLAVDYFQQSGGIPTLTSRLNLATSSDSHHSLTDSEVQKVQRTTSLSSENQSEIFYSADEELSHQLSSNGNIASSRHSIVDSFSRQDSLQSNRHRFQSDPIEIGSFHSRHSGGRLSSHSVELDMSTPEHRSHLRSSLRGLSSDLNISTSPRFLGDDHLQEVSESNSNENILIDSSDSHSISSTSFISAMSSQEDIGLVNLHMQVNRPIVESPLLMSSYINHLSQVSCPNWSRCSVPTGCDAYTISGDLFQRSEEGCLVYVGAKYSPYFKTTTEGFTFLKMLSKVLDLDSTPPASAKTPTHPFHWDHSSFFTSTDDGENRSEDEMISIPCEIGNKTTLVIKFKGDIDIMITPLVLESLQRFVDTLTPTFSTLHPLTVINHLRSECISKVEEVNILKKNENLMQYQCQPPSPKIDVTKGKDKSTRLSAALVESSNYQETLATQTQGTIIVPKINITLLQTSVVEELIAFSALDNIRDLSCVSLFAVCIDNVTAKFHFSKQTKEMLQSFIKPVMLPHQKKSGMLIKGAKPFLTGNTRTVASETTCREPVLIESSEKIQEEMIIIVNVGKLHAQLRRLPNESTVLKDAVVTAIPPQYSKVMFLYTRTTLPQQNKERIWGEEECTNVPASEDKLGFIMFESALEGVSVKIVKQEQFEKNDSEPIELSDAPPTQEEKPVQSGPSLSQAEQILSAMRFSTKTAPSKTKSTETVKPENKIKKDFVPVQRQGSNTLSCVIELSTVWFNFAAPPRTPITRKLDFSRLDWNLLSTASPSINAWMNPSSRFASRLVHMIRTKYRRSAGVVSCLMAEALEVQGVHTPLKSRYNCQTAMSKTLQEDASCQLCAILHTFILQSDLASIEANLTETYLPKLSDLRQGVIVLSRQWKNVLYTPLLLDYGPKTKRFNVTFAIPEKDEEEAAEVEIGDNIEDVEITDERAVLINTEIGGGDSQLSDKPFDGILDTSVLTSPLSPSSQSEGKKRHLPNLQPPSSSRASIVFPIINNNYPFTAQQTRHFAAADPTIGYSMLKDDKDKDLLNYQLGSDTSLYSNPAPGSQPSVTSLDSQPSEDLYSWMTKQDMTKENDTDAIEMKINEDLDLHDILEEPVLYPVQDSQFIQDANTIFEPLLSSLGVTPQQMSISSGNAAVFEAWGSNSSLVGSMETLRIDIVVSEHGKSPSDKKKGKKMKGGKFILELPPEVPAFLCEKIGVEIDIKKTADNDMFQKHNVLYISRGHLKKHTSTKLNFSLNVNYISQQVNMPLLRLLHQITSMYQNVKDTQLELKEQHLKGAHPASLTLSKEQKNGSSSTSDVQMSSVTDHLGKVSTPVGIPVFQKPASVSPSSSLLSRPQTLAQRLRSTSKSVKGYMNLNDGGTTPLDVDKSLIKPRCWKTLYNLLDLYATMPETKTIPHRFPPEMLETYRSRKNADTKQDEVDGPNTIPERQRELSIVAGERTRLIVFGVARIHRTRLLATLSGLKLEAEITNLHSSVTYRKKLRPESLECSLTGQVGRTMIVLLEGVAPNQQTVVKVTVGKSQALYSSSSRRSKDKNSGLLTVGSVNIDIPQHPVVLHGMMTRGSKQLSSTLQELGVTRASRISRGMTLDEADLATQSSPNHQSNTTTWVSDSKNKSESTLLQPLVMQFSVILQSLSINAALLPSLQAQYKMDQVNSSGVTGGKAKFTVDLPRHTLSFSTKLQHTEANLPQEASIDLPKIHVSAEYVQDGKNSAEPELADGAVLREGSYLNAIADIGKFEHSLTTDLLNHLVFVQKVFMKEINEVVQKVYGGEKVVPIWQEEEEPSSSSLKRILFSLVIRIKRIQLTATTPTNSAVRLETGAVEFQLSNRVENVSGSAQPNPYMKIFGKAQVDINLSLGQLLKNVIFEEAEPEFQQYAFFKTRIGLRNAFQGEMVEGEDKEVVLITLKRPLIYIQPLAVDKAILVWLNYKNAYEYWNEQRSDLNSEVQSATQQVFEKVPFGQLSGPHLGTLFLQLTVDDMGICIPLTHPPMASWSLNRTMYMDSESRGAVVVTLESTSISACSSGSLVSKGRFVGLCFRFADDFETSLDDWKPDMNDSSIMNLCVVSEGTYEVCSRTIAQKQSNENAKWFLNVQWQMEGVDIHLDVNVGKQLSSLGHTLTTLTGITEEDEIASADYDSDEHDGLRASQESISLRRSRNILESLPASIFDPSLDAKRRSKIIEKEMHEQAKIINDLKMLGASSGTVEQEIRRLQELEALVFKDFRRDMIQKLRRQSVKASSIKGKFGLGRNLNSYRSKSFMVSSPTPETVELESPDKITSSSRRSHDNVDSYESSPKSGPSRSASLRVHGMRTPRVVTFSESHNICRQSSLPSGDSDISVHSDIDWNGLGHMDIDGERVPLRKKYTDTESDETLDSLPFGDKLGCSSPGMTSTSSSLQKSQEPNIDFELDVKVFINSGKCVLHTKDQSKEEEIRLMNRMKKERSCSGGIFEFPPNSPSTTRRNKEAKQMTSLSRLRPVVGNAAQLVDLTIFHIPGLDVKVHYESKIEFDESTASETSFSSQTRRMGVKKASLYAWTTLQSIPEETIISPHILEFLEQTLEPIPSSVPSAKGAFPSAGNGVFGDSGSGWDGAVASGNYVYASFPVDVMVYFHMQPSTFRFSCLPLSRVECMLQLPSLDIVFSSKRAEEELSEFGTRGKPVTYPTLETGPSPSSAVGGVSVTGCLSDFSVYIFHPYGGGKKTAPKEAQWSPLSDTERKDSLSVNVEFVKFHLSRSRKINFQGEQNKGLSGSFDQSRAVIRFSTIIDIGSASFKYDMRRLSEILAFPRAWYRRSIVRRLFLGDLNISAYSEEDESPHSSTDEETALLQKERHSVDGVALSRSTTSSDRSPMSRDRLKLNFDQGRSRFKEFGRMNTVQEDSPSPEQNSRSGWETLVLFAINFKKLNVHMNMGNVMGNVMWLTKDFRSEGRLSIGSTGHKNMYIAFGLGGSNLDAKGGIVGGTIELSKIDTFIHIREDPGTEPDHTLGLKLFALELRLDYMGTGVLMCRVSSLNVSLRDEWKIHSFQTDSYIPTRRPAMIFTHGDLGWDQLQMMISKSTTADLLKMYYKLEEFFSQQFKSSKRVFSSLQSNVLPKNASFKRKYTKKSEPTAAFTSTQDAKHHRHWQKVLSMVCGMNLTSFKIPLPMTGTVLGGTMELHGNNISLACFHGINFKSKSWALFSMKEPCISFATEAQEIPSINATDSLDVHVVETLTFSLGMTSEQPEAHHHSMATICRMSRNALFPPQYKTLQEWFHYAFCSSELDAVDRFPSLERDRTDTAPSDDPKRSRGTAKLQDPNHTKEIIFALPSLQIHLKTEHLQSTKTPDLTDGKPVVECSFISEFEDHIFVTIDAEAFFFLHDLIRSYLNEKDKVLNQAGRTQSPEAEKRHQSTSKEDESKTAQFDPGDDFTKDWRMYECKTWHLEPTVRLWSWAGKSIEPYGVDYILQKLGFSHARITIPKWMQRGFMDPLDKVLAVLMLHIITMVKDNSHSSKKE